MTTILRTQTTLLCSNCSYPMEPQANFCGECGATVQATIQSQTGNWNLPRESQFSQAQVTAQPFHNRQNFGTHRAQPLSYPEARQEQYLEQSVSQSLPPTIPNQVSYDDLVKLEAFRLSQISGQDSGWKPTPTFDPKGNTVPLPPTGGAPTFAHVRASGNKVSPELVREMQTLNASLLREQFFLLMHCSIFIICNVAGLLMALNCYGSYHGDEMTRIIVALTPLTFINAVALACLAPIKGTRREISRLAEKRQYVQFQMEYSNVII